MMARLMKCINRKEADSVFEMVSKQVKHDRRDGMESVCWN